MSDFFAFDFSNITFWSLSAIFVLLILSAFFSGSETALTATSRPLMHQMEKSGSHRAGMVNRLHERKERLIGAILLGNNLVNIMGSALATSVLISMFGEAGVVYATLVMTLLILVFAEILPKTYAFRHSNRVSLFVAPVVQVLVFILSPITRAINFVVRGVFHLFGVDLHTEDALDSRAEELRGAIELHTSDEYEDRHERAMLRSVLDLTEVQVSEIMIHRRNITAVNADLPPAEIVDQVLASPFTRIPLWQGEPDNIIGVLHVRDLLRASRSDPNGKIDVVALANSPWFVPDTTLLLDQLQAFRSRRGHFAVVVDEYGSLMGIVTLEDILEEIVGDISDEHDIAFSGVHRQPDGSLVIQGSVTIRDLNRQFEWNLPDEAASTIAGLVLHEARRIPEVGQTFSFYGFRFEIVRRHRQQIMALRVTPPQSDAA